MSAKQMAYGLLFGVTLLADAASGMDLALRGGIGTPYREGLIGNADPSFLVVLQASLGPNGSFWALTPELGYQKMSSDTPSFGYVDEGFRSFEVSHQFIPVMVGLSLGKRADRAMQLRFEFLAGLVVVRSKVNSYYRPHSNSPLSHTSSTTWDIAPGVRVGANIPVRISERAGLETGLSYMMSGSYEARTDDKSPYEGLQQLQWFVGFRWSI